MHLEYEKNDSAIEAQQATLEHALEDKKIVGKFTCRHCNCWR